MLFFLFDAINFVVFLKTTNYLKSHMQSTKLHLKDGTQVEQHTMTPSGVKSITKYN